MAFDYLVILLSLIIGLAMTNLLTASARLIHRRGRQRLYFPSVFWSVLVFVFCVLHWWTDYNIRSVVHWTFAGFFGMLLVPLDLFLLSELVLPRGQDDGESLEVWFERNRRWFYGLVAVIAPLSYVEEFLLRGSIHKTTLESALLAAFMFLAVAGMFLKERKWQYSIAVVVGILVVVYIALLFSGLPT